MSDDIVVEPGSTERSVPGQQAKELVRQIRSGVPVRKAERATGMSLKRLEREQQLAQVVQDDLKEWRMDQELAKEIVVAKLLRNLYEGDIKESNAAASHLVKALGMGAPAAVQAQQVVFQDTPEIKRLYSETEQREEELKDDQ